MLYRLTVLSAITILSLTGCSPQLTSSSAAAVEKNTAKAAGKHYVKPGATVSLESSAPYTLQQSVPTDIQLVLLAGESEGVMDVRITVSDGLLLNTKNTMQFELSPKEHYVLPVNVTAHQQGRHYINLQVVTRTKQRQAARALSAIVQVGDVLSLQKNQGAVAADEDDVVSMPAQETIIP